MQANPSWPPASPSSNGHTRHRRWLRRYDLLLLALTVALLFFWPRLWQNILSSDRFMPHGTCYLWIAELVSLHLISDTLIGLSYVAISATLTYLVYRSRRDIPFRWIFLAFGLFIVACGMTHFMEVWTIWSPMFWLSGYVKLVTAVASMTTAILLPPIIPRVLGLIAASKLSEQLKTQLVSANTQLQAANKELEAFSYSVSHDLRAPLRHINGFSQALLEDYADKLDEEGKNYLHEVRSASQEMAQLIDDVLQLARVTRSEMRREVVNLSELADAVVAELRARDPRRAVIINVGEGLSTPGDKRLLRIVLSNLLGNAWKFTSKRETAEISFGREQQNGEAVYFVRDDGAGFDMTYADKLFGAFQRLHSAAEFEGTGIGLATVQRIVHRHGGHVRAEAALDRGAVFYFTLPNVKDI